MTTPSTRTAAEARGTDASGVYKGRKPIQRSEFAAVVSECGGRDI